VEDKLTTLYEKAKHAGNLPFFFVIAVEPRVL
jgi:hypothetical protein